jgi:hypothetical protein
MYTPETIQDAIFGATPLIGWEQEQDPIKAQLDTALTTTTSGRYFQNAHPALTLQNVFSIAPKFEDFTYTAWDSATAYTVGQKVSKGGKNWVSILAGTNQDPEAAESSYWTEWTVGNQKSLWLKNKTRGYILSVMDDFIEQKQWGRVAKSIIEERALFDATQYESDVIESESKVAGFELITALNMGILAKIQKVGLQFTEAGNITLNLYHSSQSSPVETQVLAITEAGSMQWFDLNWNLPYLSTYDSGGSWTIEYVQDDAPGNAINKARDWRNAPSRIDQYDNQKLWSQFLEVYPFTVAVADRKNPSKRAREYTRSFGMNLLVAVYCDYTDFFVRQKSMFQNAIMKGVGIKFLREIAMNPNGRINLGESNMNISREELLYEIDGNTQGRATGLGHEYIQAIKAIQIDTEGLTKYCLPCTRKRAKVKTMG